MSEAIELLKKQVDLLEQILDHMKNNPVRDSERAESATRGIVKGARKKASQVGRVQSTPTSLVKEPDPRHSPLVREMTEMFKRLRGVKYLFTPRDARALSNLLKIESNDAEIRMRWSTGLTETYPACHTIVDLERNWNAYAADPVKPSNDFTGWTKIADRKKGQP